VSGVNLTTSTKGETTMRNYKYFRVIASDHYLNKRTRVWEEVMKNELLTEKEAKRHDVPPDNLELVSVPACSVFYFFGVRQSLEFPVEP
jgi:hypothetical protein